MTMMDDGVDSRYRAPALDKGLDILEILAAESEGMTRAELVRAMGRGPSEIYRMLERLVARGYVSRSDRGDRYILSMKLFLLAHRHPPLRRLTAAAQPLMDDFARETGQSCHLVVPERGRGIVVAHATPEATWEFRVRIGAELSLVDTGSGLTLLAFQPGGTGAALPQRLGLSGPDAERLQEIDPHLAAIRAAGRREGPSAQLHGVTDLSAPVFGPDGDAIAVLTCAFIHHPGETDDSRTLATTKLSAVTARLSFGEPAGDGTGGA